MCLQMQSTLCNTIEKKHPVFFNKYIINLSSDISYDYNSGYFTINSNGIYHISWWISGYCGINSEPLSFKIRSCKGDTIESCTPFSSGQIHGEAIIKVSNNHLSFALINSCESEVYLQSPSNANANICIYKIANNWTYKNIESNHSSTIYL